MLFSLYVIRLIILEFLVIVDYYSGFVSLLNLSYIYNIRIFLDVQVVGLLTPRLETDVTHHYYSLN